MWHSLSKDVLRPLRSFSTLSPLEGVAAALRDANPAAVASLPLATRLAIARLGRAAAAGAPPPPLSSPPRAHAPAPAPPPPPARVFVALARTLQPEDAAALPTADLAEVLVALRCGIARGGSVAVQDPAASAALGAIEGELAQRDDLDGLGDEALTDVFASALAHTRSPILQRLAREVGRRGRTAATAAAAAAAEEQAVAAPAEPAAGARPADGAGAARPATSALRESAGQIGRAPLLREFLQRADLVDLGRPRAARAVASRSGAAAGGAGAGASAGAAASGGGNDDESRVLVTALVGAGAVLAALGAAVSLVIAGSRRAGGAAARRPPAAAAAAAAAAGGLTRDQYLRFRVRALGSLGLSLPLGPAPRVPPPAPAA